MSARSEILDVTYERQFDYDDDDDYYYYYYYYYHYYHARISTIYDRNMILYCTNRFSFGRNSTMIRWRTN